MNMDEVKTMVVFFEGRKDGVPFTGTVKQCIDICAKDLVYNNRVIRVELK